MKRFLLPAMALVLMTAGCGKSYEANDAVKADLQNYFAYEVPRVAPVFRALNAVSAAAKSGGQTDPAQLIVAVSALQNALAVVQSMRATTPELKEIHQELVDGFLEVNGAMENVKGITDPSQIGPGMLFTLTRGLISGMKAVGSWREELEKIAAANGLQQECAAALQQLEPPAGQ